MRDYAAWERCERNLLTGLHNWTLDWPVDETGKRVMKQGKIAKCHVCRAQPPPIFRADVAQRVKDMAEAARRGWQ